MAGQVSVGELLVRPIIAARVEPQRARVLDNLDAAIAQVGLDQRAGRSAATSRRAAAPLRANRRNGRASGLGGWARFHARQAKEASCFLGDIAKLDEPAALADHVEEVAVFGRGGIRPMPGGTWTGFRPAEPDEH